MTLRRARLYTWLFVGLAGCAAANIMLFQQRLPMRGMGGAYGDSSAGGIATRSITVPGTVGGRAIKTAAVPQPVDPPTLNETVNAIQRELKAVGHYGGSVDGRPSRALTAAIIAYQFEQGLPVDGESSEALVKRLILGATLQPARKYLPGEIVPGSPADKLVRWVIAGLNSLGHEAGPPQSRLDTSALRAIRAFESAERMAQSGRIGEALVRQLESRLP